MPEFICTAPFLITTPQVCHPYKNQCFWLSTYSLVAAIYDDADAAEEAADGADENDAAASDAGEDGDGDEDACNESPSASVRDGESPSLEGACDA